MENFFDPFVDSTLTYNEFTEKGSQKWTMQRFYQKRNNIYKALLAFSHNQAIGILGVCEVENEFVLNALFGLTPLKRFNYRWIHYDGPDRRGIDPAIVYSLDRFQLLYSEAFPYRNPDNPNMVSRDILYAKFFDYRQDTLHCFVNHWPSKRGGAASSDSRREAVSELLRLKIDSLQKQDPSARILLVGDFNDTPDGESLKALCDSCSLHNMALPLWRKGMGSIRYKGKWELIDQAIVSQRLAGEGAVFSIFAAAFLQEPDNAYLGLKPKRTFVGPRYNGGVSDHLPVLVRIKKE